MATNNSRNLRTNSKGEKLYPISITKHQHNIELAYTKMWNRRHDAKEAGDMAAVARLDARMERCDKYRDELRGSCGCGWFTGAEYADAMAMINWARSCRMVACERNNVPYVE